MSGFRNTASDRLDGEDWVENRHSSKPWRLVRYWRKAADSNTLSAAGRIREVKSESFGHCSTKP
jgi:hypothetical protein